MQAIEPLRTPFGNIEVERVDRHLAKEAPGASARLIERKHLREGFLCLGAVVLLVQQLRLDEQRRPVEAIKILVRSGQQTDHTSMLRRCLTRESSSNGKSAHTLDNDRGVIELRLDRQRAHGRRKRILGILEAAHRLEGLAPQARSAHRVVALEQLDRLLRPACEQRSFGAQIRRNAFVSKGWIGIRPRHQRSLRTAHRVVEIRDPPQAVEGAHGGGLVRGEVGRFQCAEQPLGRRRRLDRLDRADQLDRARMTVIVDGLGMDDRRHKHSKHEKACTNHQGAPWPGASSWPDPPASSSLRSMRQPASSGAGSTFTSSTVRPWLISVLNSMT